MSSVRKRFSFARRAAVLSWLSVLNCTNVQNPFDVAPQISYPDTVIAYGGEAIDTVRPSLAKNVEVEAYVVTPPLPKGLDLDSISGAILGRPSDTPGVSVHTVAARNRWGTSNLVQVAVMLCPPQPAAPCARAYRADSVVLTWRPIVGVDTYYVYRASTNPTGLRLLDTLRDTVFIDHSSLQIDTAYFYCISAQARGTRESHRSGAVTVLISSVLDTTAPLISITFPSRDTLVNTPHLTIGYTVDGHARTKAVTLAEGLNVVVIDTFDLAGNYGSDTVRVRLDTVAPDAPTVQGTALVADSLPRWTWIPGAGDGMREFRCKLNDPNLTTGATLVDSASFRPSHGLPSGTYVLYVQERDSAGNWSASGSFTTQIDVTPPAPPFVEASSITDKLRPVWTWGRGSGDGDGRFRYRLDNSNLSVGATETTGLSFAPQADLTANPHTLYVQERDSIGNWSTSGFAVVVVRPDLVFVDSAAVVGAHDGSSWADAFLNIDTAVQRAGTREIWVAKGTYYTAGVVTSGTIRGGFAGTEVDSARDWQHHLSVLSGDIGVRGVVYDNAAHVVVMNSGSLVEGFVIRDGRASVGLGSEGAGVRGGGGILRHCAIHHHTEGDIPDVYLTPPFRMDGCVIVNSLLVKAAGGSSNQATVTNCILVGVQCLSNGDSLALTNATLVSSTVSTNSSHAYARNCALAQSDFRQGSGGYVTQVACCYQDSAAFKACASAGQVTKAVIGNAAFVSQVTDGYAVADTAWFTDGSPLLLNSAMSPCHNSGDFLPPSSADFDIRGHRRPYTYTEQYANPVDIGAYEQ